MALPPPHGCHMHHCQWLFFGLSSMGWLAMYNTSSLASVNCLLYQPIFLIMVLVWVTLTIVCEPHWRAEAELFFWVEFYNRFSDMCFQVAILTTFGTWAATAEQLQIGQVSPFHYFRNDMRSSLINKAIYLYWVLIQFCLRNIERNQFSQFSTENTSLD